MKAEALAFLYAMTIEAVADNGNAKTLPMSAMHTQLMGAAGMWHQCNTGETPLMAQHLVVGHRLLAVLVVHHLSRTVIHVRAQRQADGTASFYHTI